MKLGPYEILSTLGRGGMGVVYRARSPEGDEVAVKLLIEGDGARRARFDRERRLLEELGEAEGFVPLLDAGDSSNGPWIAMPLIAGGTLRDRLMRGPLGIEETARLGRELARALARAHELGIVHRDLKPENILYTVSGRALIADLGLAKHFSRDFATSASLSAAGTFRGTVGYMAPEQMRDSKSVGPAADVFALGAILHECLAGERAFEGESAIEVLTRVEAGTYMPISRRRPGVPAELAAAIQRSLAVDAAKRFPDALSFARALEGVGLPAARSRAFPLAVLIVLLALGGAAGAWAVAVGTERAHEHEAPAGEPKDGHGKPIDSATLAGRDAPHERGATAVAEALTARATIAVVMSWPATAILDASAAIDLAPSSARAYHVRGVARLMLRQLPGALADCTKAIELDPNEPRYYGARGVVIFAIGGQKQDDAIEEFSRSLELDVEQAVIWRLRGLCHFGAHILEPAREDYRHAVALERDYATPWYELALVDGQLDANDDEISDYETFLRLEPEGERADEARKVLAAAHDARMERLGVAFSDLFHKKDYPAALDSANKRILLYPTRAQGWSDRGAVWLQTNETDKALADFDEAIRLDPKLALAYVDRGIAHRKKGDFPAAFADYAKAIDLEPEGAEAYVNRAVLHEQLHEDAKALADFKRFAELKPDFDNIAIVRSKIAALEAKTR